MTRAVSGARLWKQASEVVSATPEVEERLGKKRASSDGPELTSEQRKKLALIGGLINQETGSASRPKKKERTSPTPAAATAAAGSGSSAGATAVTPTVPAATGLAVHPARHPSPTACCPPQAPASDCNPHQGLKLPPHTQHNHVQAERQSSGPEAAHGIPNLHPELQAAWEVLCAHQAAARIQIVQEDDATATQLQLQLQQQLLQLPQMPAPQLAIVNAHVQQQVQAIQNRCAERLQQVCPLYPHRCTSTLLADANVSHACP